MFRAPHLLRWKGPVVAFLCFVAVVMAVRFRPLFTAPMLEEADYAVNALQIRNAMHFQEIYGNYSRFEFHHPGPAFFYVYAAAEFVLYDAWHLVPSPGNAHLVAIIGLQSLFLMIALCLLTEQLRWRPVLPLAWVAAAVLIGLRPYVLVSIWPPHVLPMPFLCFLVACTSLGTGQIRHLPIATLAGGFLFHGHVAQPLFVLSLGVLAGLFGVQSARREFPGGIIGILTRHRVAIAIGAGLGALFLLPLVLDAVTLGMRSNIAAIVGRFEADAADHASFAQAVLYFISYPIASREQDTVFTNMGAPAWQFLREHELAAGCWLAILVAPVAITIVLRRRWEPGVRRFFGVASILLGVACVDCVFWGMAQAGAIRHYNGCFYDAVYFFALLLLVALAARLFDAFWRRSLTLGAGLLALFCAGRLLHAHPESRVERGLAIKQAVDAALAAGPDHRPRVLVFDRTNWNIAAAVALELDRHGVPFYVLPWWSFMFGPAHDFSHVSQPLESQMAAWWIVRNGPEGIALARDTALFLEPAQLNPAGADIDFTPNGNGFRYVLSGVRGGDFNGRDNFDGVQVNERRAVFRFVPGRATTDVSVVIEGHPDEMAEGPQPLEFFFDGERLAPAAACAGQAAVVVPAAWWNRKPVATLELRFPNAVAHRAAERPNYPWWSSWQIRRIHFETR